MATTETPAEKSAPSPREVCTNPQCRHPKPFHKPDGCKAFGCHCPGFTADAPVKDE